MSGRVYIDHVYQRKQTYNSLTDLYTVTTEQLFCVRKETYKIDLRQFK